MKNILLFIALLLVSLSAAAQEADDTSLAQAFAREVDRRLDVPLPEQARFALLLKSALAAAATSEKMEIGMRREYVLTCVTWPLNTPVFRKEHEMYFA